MYLALLFVGIVGGFIGNLVLFADVPVFDGFRVDDSGTKYGVYTKNEVRRGMYFTLFILVLSSLKDSYYDRDHVRMYFGKI